MIALVIPNHALAVLASVRFLIAVLDGEAVMDVDASDLSFDPEWVASVVAGAYCHGAQEIVNVRNVHRALRETAGVRVSIRSARALVSDITSRIG